MNLQLMLTNYKWFQFAQYNIYATYLHANNFSKLSHYQVALSPSPCFSTNK